MESVMTAGERVIQARLEAGTNLDRKAAAVIRRLATELARLRADRKTLDAIDAAAGSESPLDLIAAAKRLPKTRDGVRISPTDTIYRRCSVCENRVHLWVPMGEGDAAAIEKECYSTPTAAEAASETEGGAK